MATAVKNLKDIPQLGVASTDAMCERLLAEQGRQVLGFASPQKMEQKMEQAKPKRTLVIVQKGKRSPVLYVKDFCKALAERMRQDPDKGAYTHYRDLAADIGYAQHSAAISRIVPEAIRLGYIQPKLPKTHGLFFTDKGRAKFMPETVEAEDLPSVEPVTEQPRSFGIFIGGSDENPTNSLASVATAQRGIEPSGGLDFDLTSRRLRVSGATQSRAELAAFIGKLGALMPFLGE